MDLHIVGSTTISPRLTEHSGLGVAPQAPWGLKSSSNSVASSVGVEDTMGSSSVNASNEFFRMSSFSSHIRGAMHLWRLQTVPNNTLEGATEHSVHQWSTLACSRVCSLLTSLISHVSQKSSEGKKTWQHKVLRLGGAFHQHSFSRAASSLKLAACLLVSACAWVVVSLMVPPWRGTGALATS